MPIRLNLLAEVQAAEEVRRRDPVKRVIWIAALLVCLTLVWWSWLLVDANLARNEISRGEASIASHTNDYQMVMDNQKKVVDTLQKLGALQCLATNRFLYGNLLNALQQTTVDGLRVTHFKLDQSYTLIEETKPRASGDRTLPAIPARVIEHNILTLDARDASTNPGGIMMSKFQETIASNDYFRNFLGRSNVVRLIKYSPPQAMPGEGAFVSFTVQCASPEKTR